MGKGGLTLASSSHKTSMFQESHIDEKSQSPGRSPKSLSCRWRRREILTQVGPTPRPQEAAVY